MVSKHHPPSFGAWLKAQRTARELTQSHLAHMAGCATVTIKRIEADRLRPSEQLVSLLLKSLDIPEAEHPALITLARASHSAAAPPAQTAAPPAPDQSVLRNPYKGLRAYTEADAPDFFGRTVMITRLLQRIAEPNAMARCLVVVGPSGSGKSSVVHAGLLPALRQGLLPGTRQWLIAEMRPGDHPLEELEAALLRVAVNPPETLLAQLHEDERGLLRAVKRVLPMDPQVDLLLVIDQFEELFTLVTDEAQRAYLLRSLLETVSDPRSRLRLLIVLRSDFYDQALAYRPLGELMQQRTEVVLPLTAHEIEEAIVGPATNVGVHLEPDLVQTVVRDAGTHLGMLPLLQYALTELFERREGHTLTRAAYQASGGVAGALTRRAEDLYTHLDPAHQEAARRLFLRLITPGEGVHDTRRRVRLAELDTTAPRARNGHAPSPLQTVIACFSHYRLLTLDADPATREPTIELAHEALIASWGRLRDWIASSREELRTHRLLTEAAREWERLGYDEGALYRGVRLAQAQEWAGEHPADLNDLERRFVQASQHAAMDAARQAELTRQRELAQAQALAQEQQRRIDEQTKASRRLRRRALYLSIAVGLALFAALIAGILGIQANSFAAEARGLALVSASQAALAQGAPNHARALGLAAVRAEHPAPHAALTLAQAAYPPGTRRLFLGHTSRVWSLDFSADGATFLSGSRDETMRLWDVATGEELRRFEGHTSTVMDVAFSPDEATALSGSWDTTMRLWDVATGEEIRRLEGHTDAVMSVAFSADGATVVSASRDGTLRLWDVASGEEVRRFAGHEGAVNSVVFGPDGQTILSGSRDETVRLWDVASGEEVRRFAGHTDAVMSVAFSPGPGRLQALSGSFDGTLRLWDVASGEEVRRFAGHTAPVWTVAVSFDGRYAVSGSFDTTLRLWDVATGAELYRLSDHTDAVMVARFSPDPSHLRVLSGAWDDTVRLWDMTNGQQVRRFEGHTDEIPSVAVSPDGQAVLSGGADGTVRIWETDSAQPLHRVVTQTEGVNSVAYSPDGRRVLIGAADGTLMVWDIFTQRELLRWRGHEQPVNSVAFSPDGQFIASGADDYTIGLWDAERGAEVRRLSGHTRTVQSVAFSPDGQTLASGSFDGTLRLWDVASGEEVRRFEPDVVQSVAFSPDGRAILAGTFEGVVRLWDVATGQEVQRLTGHQGAVQSVAFSPDGQHIASSSFDGTLRLWDAASGLEQRRIAGHRDAVLSIAFHPHAAVVLSGSADGTVRLWRLDTLDELITWTCANRYVQPLTAEQRAIYHTGSEPLCN
jgi:WD40 repeat protein/transcriptional regulator with XRE-family HTH domain